MAKEYEQIELMANVHDLHTLWNAVKEVEWSRLPALTIKFSNVPGDMAEALRESLGKSGFDCE